MTKEREALKLALDYFEGVALSEVFRIEVRDAIKEALAQQNNEQALEALKWIASHDLSGADERALALMSYAFVHKARFAVLEATGERA